MAIFDPTALTSTTPQYFFLSDDIDGNGTLNSAYTSYPPKVSTWVNKGGTGGNLTGGSGTTANKNPLLRPTTSSGHPSVCFDGYYNVLTASGSASAMNQWWTTGAQGEFMMLLRINERDSSPRILGSGEGGFTNYIEVYGSSNAIRFEIRSTSGIALQLSSPAVKRGNLYLYNCHHNGNSFKASINGGQTENSGTRTNSVAAADAVRDFYVGATNNAGAAIPSCVEIFMLWIASTELSAPERLSFYTTLQSLYPDIS